MTIVFVAIVLHWHQTTCRLAFFVSDSDGIRNRSGGVAAMDTEEAVAASAETLAGGGGNRKIGFVGGGDDRRNRGSSCGGSDSGYGTGRQQRQWRRQTETEM